MTQEYITKYISHRGNLNGKNPQMENRPTYITSAIDLGFDVEVDLRYENHQFYLGHDEAQYPIDIEFLKRYSRRLWLHCKDVKSIEMLKYYESGGFRNDAEFSARFGIGDKTGRYRIAENMCFEFNYFWHQTDDYTITSQGYVWTYPGKKTISSSIVVLPEQDDYFDITAQYTGICSDFIEDYRNKFIEWLKK